MHVLFVHQNYPAQFRFIAPRLARDFGWRCTFVTRNTKTADLPGVERINYSLAAGATAANHPCTRGFETCTGHALGVYAALKARPDVRPARRAGPGPPPGAGGGRPASGCHGRLAAATGGMRGAPGGMRGAPGGLPASVFFRS